MVVTGGREKTGGTGAVLVMLGKINSLIGNLEARQSKLEQSPEAEGKRQD